MAIDLKYQTKKKRKLPNPGNSDPTIEWTETEKHFNTEQEGVKQIIPKENKVAIHLEGETIMIPFNRVLELRVDLDPETVKQVEKANKESE